MVISKNKKYQCFFFWPAVDQRGRPLPNVANAGRQSHSSFRSCRSAPQRSWWHQTIPISQEHRKHKIPPQNATCPSWPKLWAVTQLVEFGTSSWRHGFFYRSWRQGFLQIFPSTNSGNNLKLGPCWNPNLGLIHWLCFWFWILSKDLPYSNQM